MGRLWLAGILAVTICAAAEVETRTATVTATYSSDVLPGQVQLYVTLMAPVEVGLDDILSQIKNSGITAADLSNVYTPFGNVTGLSSYSQWTFTPIISVDNMKTVLTALNRLAASLGEVGGFQALSYQVTGLVATDAFRAAQFCPLPALVSDAWRQAEAMAEVAGMRAGQIVSVSDAPALDGVGGVSFAAQPPNLALRGAVGLIGSWFYPSPVYQQPCSLTVQFRLLPN